MGAVTIDKTFVELVIDTSVLTGVELGETVGDVIPEFPEEDSIENAVVGSSDMVEFVLRMVVVKRLVVSAGDDAPWDSVCAGVESLGEGKKLEGKKVVTSVCVV